MSTRNFDSGDLTLRTQSQTTARNLFVSQTSGLPIISNPQNSDARAGLLELYHVGSQTSYSKGILGGVGTYQLGATVTRAAAPAPATGGTVPSAPTLVSIAPTDSELDVSFTAGSSGSSAITAYQYSLDGGSTWLTATGTSSPIAITGLTNGVSYTVILRAVNSVGAGAASSSLSGTPVGGGSPPLAPVLTGVSFITDTAATITFTQASNGVTVTNYKYSLNGGSFVALSPVDTISPATITGLTPGTAYDIQFKAMSLGGDSPASNTISATTYTTVNYATFTTPGTTTWTAPAGVTWVQYLVIGGGGGGGATYSDILVLGSVPFVASNPGGATTYWINSSAGSFYGYFFKGGSTYTLNRYARITAPQAITPTGTTYIYNQWYPFEMVYYMNSTFPSTTNYFGFSPPISTDVCNNDSGGSGGGAGGQYRFSLSGTKYTVTPGTSYTVTVGAGGAGGVATGGGPTGTEAAGSAGGNSVFDTITAAGGSGGGASRGSTSTNGYGNGGAGGLGYGNLVGGSGGGQRTPNNYGLYNSGGAGGGGVYLNFDGNGNVLYSQGGNGGVPNTVASGTTVANTGRGGAGTGATLNSSANGIAGGSGIVIIKYYT